jgi:hypothetical protein
MTFLSHKEQGNIELSLRLRKEGIIKTVGAPFEATIKAEINGLMASNVFKIVKYDPVKYDDIKIFNSRVVNEVKGKTTTPFEKSRLVI